LKRKNLKRIKTMNLSRKASKKIENENRLLARKTLKKRKRMKRSSLKISPLLEPFPKVRIKLSYRVPEVQGIIVKDFL